MFLYVVRFPHHYMINCCVQEGKRVHIRLLQSLEGLHCHVCLKYDSFSHYEQTGFNVASDYGEIFHSSQYPRDPAVRPGLHINFLTVGS